MTDGLRIEQIVQNLQPQNVEGKQRSRQASSASETEGENASSQALQLSPQAQDVRQAAQALRSLPDVRQQKIQKLQQQLAQGQFKVLPDILAQKLLDQIFPSSTE